MNWGKGIVVVLAVFILFIGTLVTKMLQASTDLESEDYYAKEVAFESEIQAIKLANEMNANVIISRSESHLVFQLPELDIKNVKIKLIRPNDSELDKVYDVSDTKNFLVDMNELKKGIYKVEISFKLNDKECLHRESIKI